MDTENVFKCFPLKLRALTASQKDDSLVMRKSGEMHLPN